MKDIGMSRAVAYDVLPDAQKYITETTQKDFEDSFNEAVQQLEQQMSKESNRKVWLELRRELNKLKGLYRPQRIDVTTNGKDINTISIEIVTPKKDDDNEKEEFVEKKKK